MLIGNPHSCFCLRGPENSCTYIGTMIPRSSVRALYRESILVCDSHRSVRSYQVMVCRYVILTCEMQIKSRKLRYVNLINNCWFCLKCETNSSGKGHCRMCSYYTWLYNNKSLQMSSHVVLVVSERYQRRNILLFIGQLKSRFLSSWCP